MKVDLLKTYQELMAIVIKEKDVMIKKIGMLREEQMLLEQLLTINF